MPPSALSLAPPLAPALPVLSPMAGCTVRRLAPPWSAPQIRSFEYCCRPCLNLRSPKSAGSHQQNAIGFADRARFGQPSLDGFWPVADIMGSCYSGNTFSLGSSCVLVAQIIMCRAIARHGYLVVPEESVKPLRALACWLIVGTHNSQFDFQ